MINLWKESDAKYFSNQYRKFGKDVALRTYSAQLIGQNPALVLHGGGNTSVKTTLETITKEKIQVLCIKGSGWDLSTIEPQGHPAVKMAPLLSLHKLRKLSDEDMVNALRVNMLDSKGPNPSVEALLHAFLPHKFIDHTHADAVLAAINQRDGLKRVKEWAGNKLGVVPYIMPGFALSKLALKVYEKNPAVEGLVLYKHGIFTFGKTARESYDRMIHWVTQAEKYNARFKPKKQTSIKIKNNTQASVTGAIANQIRQACFPNRLLVSFRTSKDILNFVNNRACEEISKRGPATPDHVIRTKAKALYVPPRTKSIASLVDAYRKSYRSYFTRQSRKKRVSRTMLDSDPRIVLVPGMGIFGLGKDTKACTVALDIYEHTISIMNQGNALGRYEVLSESDLFDMEYWSLEQAKLGKQSPKELEGHVVWISGGSRGIGLATTKAFAKKGAHIFIADNNEAALNKAIASLKLKTQLGASVTDVTDPAHVKRSFDLCSTLFGGVDIVVSNAGIAPVGAMDTLDETLLRKSFEINFFAHQTVAQVATEVFKRQGFGGSLLFNASKSAFNPGPGFGPYTLPKTAVVGLMKQYAVELGKISVRSNAVNADRVNTQLYGEGLLEKRAKMRGLTIKDYLSGNLLGKEVKPEDVANAFVALTQAKKTTGAVFPVDGGNAAAFPR